MTATAVLVHGGWSGPWIWTEVVELLGERGVPNVAVQLPSVGSAGPDVGFKADAAHVREVIDGIGGDVVLAGNSYGGVVITEAAVENPAVKHLVYFAAFMPGEDENLMELLQRTSDPEFGALISFDDNMISRIDVEGCIRRAFHQAPEKAVARVRAQLGVPMSWGADITTSVSGSSWRATPSTYVVCTEDLAIRPEMQREWAKTRASGSVEWSSDHCPQSSHPEDVADLIARLAV